MTQDGNDNSLFTVASGETVTVTLQAVQCNCLTSGGFDGSPLAQQGANPDTYSFKVTGNSGDQKLFAGVCRFPTGTDAFARYTVAVSSDQGGNFQASAVICVIPRVDFQLTFAIA